MPWLAIDGNDIGMARQHDTVGHRIAIARGERREQVGLAARIVERERRRCAERFQVGPRPLDQREIGFTTRCIETDPLADQR